MRYGRYGWPYLLLRSSLGLTFVWIGVDILRHPTSWIGYVPANLPTGLDRSLTLQLGGVFDVALGLLFLADRFPKTTALLAALHIGGVLATQGIDAVVVRDIGLLGASLALFTWPHHRRRHRLQKLLFWRRRTSSDIEE